MNNGEINDQFDNIVSSVEEIKPPKIPGHWLNRLVKAVKEGQPGRRIGKRAGQ
ncbi:hypothetical protein LCGC14_1542830 [marine sediment metagenome]|uniref:Uncharacterized protein n=1 Tax=marine sediment metagenome TaxID=412755 RepID=A0A0F9ISL5_9ZZZZ